MDRLIDTDPNTWLLFHVENIIKQRCLHGVDRIDLLQSMIEATDFIQKISSVGFLRYCSTLSKSYNDKCFFFPFSPHSYQNIV